MKKKTVEFLMNVLTNGQETDIQNYKRQYALQTMVNELEKTILMTILFGTMGYLEEFIICFFATSCIRINCGGKHMHNSILCFMYSSSIFLIVVILSKRMQYYPWMSLILLFLYMYFIYRIVPYMPNRTLYFSTPRKNAFKCRAILFSSVLSFICVFSKKYGELVFWDMFLLCVEYINMIEKGG